MFWTYILFLILNELVKQLCYIFFIIQVFEDSSRYKYSQ